MGERTRDGVDKVSQWQLPKSQTEDSRGTWWRNRRVVHKASYRGLVLTTELPSLVPMQKLCLHGFHDKQHMILGYGAIIPNKHKRTPNLEWLRSPSTSPDPLDSQFQCLFCTEFLGLRISEDFPPLWCISVQKSVLFLAFSSNTNFSPQCRSLTEIWKPDSCKEIYINPLLSPITNFFFLYFCKSEDAVRGKPTAEHFQQHIDLCATESPSFLHLVQASLSLMAMKEDMASRQYWQTSALDPLGSKEVHYRVTPCVTSSLHVL